MKCPACNEEVPGENYHMRIWGDKSFSCQDRTPTPLPESVLTDGKKECTCHLGKLINGFIYWDKNCPIHGKPSPQPESKKRPCPNCGKLVNNNYDHSLGDFGGWTCKASGAAASDEEAESDIGPWFDMPQHVAEAERVIHLFFARRGSEQWEYGNIASRDLVFSLQRKIEQLKLTLGYAEQRYRGDEQLIDEWHKVGLTPEIVSRKIESRDAEIAKLREQNRNLNRHLIYQEDGDKDSQSTYSLIRRENLDALRAEIARLKEELSKRPVQAEFELLADQLEFVQSENAQHVATIERLKKLTEDVISVLRQGEASISRGAVANLLENDLLKTLAAAKTPTERN